MVLMLLSGQPPKPIMARICELRRRRWTGKQQIVAQVGVSPATVNRVLRRRHLNGLKSLEPVRAGAAL